MNGSDRGRIRDALRGDFGPVCAYCQQFCQPTQPRLRNEAEETPPSDEESIDHFRPRDNFRPLEFDWLNLIYACYRCNQQKGGKWPFLDDRMNQLLTAVYRPRYTPVSEYVNPNRADGRRPADEYFDWDFESGEMIPSEQLDQEEWSIARRTIDDIDLNHALSEVESNDPNHILNLRRYHLYLFLEQLHSLEDSDLRERIIQGFRFLDQPFFGFISAYLKNNR